MLDDEVIPSAEELISMDTINTQSITLAANTPLLISYKEDISNPQKTCHVIDFDYEQKDETIWCVLDYANSSNDNESVKIEIVVYDSNNNIISSAALNKIVKANDTGRVECSLYVGESEYNIKCILT